MKDCPWCGHAGGDHHVTRFAGRASIRVACLGCQPYFGRDAGPCCLSAAYKPSGWTIADMQRTTARAIGTPGEDARP